MASIGKARYVGKMTSKGQTTVPKEVRDFLGLEEGTLVEWVLDEGKATLKPRTLRAVDLAGMLGPSPVANLTIEQMNEGIGKAVGERFRRTKWR